MNYLWIDYSQKKTRISSIGKCCDWNNYDYPEAFFLFPHLLSFTGNFRTLNNDTPLVFGRCFNATLSSAFLILSIFGSAWRWLAAIECQCYDVNSPLHQTQIQCQSIQLLVHLRFVDSFPNRLNAPNQFFFSLLILKFHHSMPFRLKFDRTKFNANR